MIYWIDDLLDTQVEVCGRWFTSRPLPGPLRWRIRDAWNVLTGRADAVEFVETLEDLQEMVAEKCAG